jgi:hypothetical protein
MRSGGPRPFRPWKRRCLRGCLSGEATLRAEGAGLFPEPGLPRRWRMATSSGAAGRQDPRLFAGLHAPVAGPGRGRLDHAARDRGPDVAGGVHHPLGDAGRHGRCARGVGPGPAARFRARVRRMLSEALPALRTVIAAATRAGLPVPALSAALQHFDQMRQARGTANMIQACATGSEPTGSSASIAPARPGFTARGVRTPERRPQFTRP